MSPYEHLSNEQLLGQIRQAGGSEQQGLIAELRRRESSELVGQAAGIRQNLSDLQSGFSEVRQGVTRLEAGVSAANANLATLRRSHSVHKWILVFAILAVVLAGAPYVERLWHWLQGK